MFSLTITALVPEAGVFLQSILKVFLIAALFLLYSLPLVVAVARKVMNDWIFFIWTVLCAGPVMFATSLKDPVFTVVWLVGWLTSLILACLWKKKEEE